MYTLPIYAYAVSLYMHTLVLYSVQCRYAYNRYSAAIYSTDTVPHCKVTLCSLYTVSLCSINTVSLISLKLYSIHSVTLHAYYVTIQCTHAISIYIVCIFPVKCTQCLYAVLLYSVNVTIKGIYANYICT